MHGSEFIKIIFNLISILPNIQANSFARIAQNNLCRVVNTFTLACTIIKENLKDFKAKLRTRNFKQLHSISRYYDLDLLIFFKFFNKKSQETFYPTICADGEDGG